jgi:hypothetical protein
VALGFSVSDIGTRHTVEVVLGGRSTLDHVYKRLFVDYFLRKVGRAPPLSSHYSLTSGCQVSTWYALVVFTASMQEYADPVIDWLDAGHGILACCLFRQTIFVISLRYPSRHHHAVTLAPDFLMDLISRICPWQNRITLVFV